MKGISAVIATILMLMITIALAGTAYLYITGVFTSRTGVVLSIDGASSTCASNGGAITLWLRNDGSAVAAVSSVTFTAPNGAVASLTCTPLPLPINAGGTNSTSCTGRSATAGLYSISASAGSSSATGSIYCAS